VSHLVGLVALALAAGPPGLLAGAAKVEITPPTGGPMWGYANRHDAACQGTHDPLFARALVLAVGDTRVALVSLDLGRAPPRDTTAAVRQRARAAGVGEVFLVASHTHHGPVLELDDWPSRDAPYLRTLEQALGGAIADAAKALRPAWLAVAARDVPLNRNRHSKRSDAPVDRTLTVIRVDDDAGKPLATAVHFAAHPTMRPGKLLEFSADWPGPMAAEVERQTGGAACLFLQGAAGDLSPNPPGERTPEAFGQAVAAEALALRTSAKPAAGPASLTAASEELRFAGRLDVSNPVVKFALGRAFFPGLVAAYEREYRDGVRPALTVALLDGRLGLVGVSGEMFCGHALSLRRRARLGHCLLLGYTNGYHQYFPTIEAASEGGYGAETPVAMAELGAGERLVDRGLIRLYQMRGLAK
jgi:neutral ceramidase